MRTLSTFFKKTAAGVFLLFLLQTATANNVQITNLTVVNSTTLRFDLSWENSWRVSYSSIGDSYDGVYVFFKYRPSGGTTQFSPVNFTLPNDLSGFSTRLVSVSYDGYFNTGCFIFPSTAYSGSPNLTNLTANLPIPLPFDVDVRAYAIEMVYAAGRQVNSSPNFFLGDGNGSLESARAFHSIGSNNSSYILGQGSLTADVGNYFLYDDDYLTSLGISFPFNGYGIQWGGDPMGGGTVNNSFHNGLPPFWAMKYEITQAGYRDFLNSLSLEQQGSRVALAPTSLISPGAIAGMPAFGSGNRNYIELKTPGNATDGTPAVFGCDADGNNVWDEASDGEWVACNMLNYEDIYAWLDWVGLGFMTELQFEILARGMNQPAKFGEYAWGSTSIFTPPGNAYTLTNPSASNEVANASATLGNANYVNSAPSGNDQGPLRNGVFGTANSTRTTSGASFYGAMELSGNVTELCVSIGNSVSRSYSSYDRGDGYLSTNGKGNFMLSGPGETDMPLLFIFRGGSWGSTPEKLRISDRSGGFPSESAERSPYNGGRGVFNLSAN